MEKKAECKICFFLYDTSRKPLIFQCGHSFCSDCIKSVIEQDGACPSCRTNIGQSINQLPVNFSLLELASSGNEECSSISTDHLSESESNNKCLKHENQQLQYLCTNLDIWLCDLCIKEHKHPEKVVYDLKTLFNTSFTFPKEMENLDKEECVLINLDEALHSLKAKGQKYQAEKFLKIQEVIDSFEVLSNDVKTVTQILNKSYCTTSKNLKDQKNVLKNLESLKNQLKSLKKMALQQQSDLTDVNIELENIENIEQLMSVNKKIKDDQEFSELVSQVSKIQELKVQVKIYVFYSLIFI